MDLDEQFEYLTKKGDQQDVLVAMRMYRDVCEAWGMSAEQIEKDLKAFVQRVMHPTRPKWKAAAW